MGTRSLLVPPTLSQPFKRSVGLECIAAASPQTRLCPSSPTDTRDHSAIALEHNASVFTLDQDFSRIARIVPLALALNARSSTKSNLRLLPSHVIDAIDMWATCNYAHHMSRMIQVRNVPDTLHRTLKVRAAIAGVSLSDYLLAEIRQMAERPTLSELCERLHRRAPVAAPLSAARAVRAERDSR